MSATRAWRLLSVVLLAAPLAATAGEPEARAKATVPDWYCLSSALHMIRMAETALAERADAAFAMHRRGLLYEWRQRLALGESPCVVYREIFEAAGDYF